MTGSADQYTYDQNGNMTSDEINRNKNIKYDHRNLITELRHKELVHEDSIVYVTYYNYDEAGNRIAKTVYRYTDSSEPSDTLSEEDVSISSSWELYKVEIYSRDVSGRELAVYKDNAIEEYPTYGLDMIGKLKNDIPYYYYKDHLGSVRAVVNANNELVSAQDYDQWGYILQGRTYESDDSKFKFTGKERDEENKYDYFGARYYDARVGRWGQVEPLLDKYPELTPYNFSVDNPLRVIDPNGADPFEIIVRTYIPFDVVFPGFKGDSRGTDPNASSFRTEQRVTIETDRSKSPTIIQGDDKAILSPSTSINLNGVPPFLYGVGEGTFSVVASYSSDINEGNNASVELSGEAHVGIIPSIFTPAIDYSFGITILPKKDGSVQVLLSGSHDKFPAYEIYIKDKSGKITPIYNQSPVDPIVGPFDLFPFPIGDVKTKVNSNQLIP